MKLRPFLQPFLRDFGPLVVGGLCTAVFLLASPGARAHDHPERCEPVPQEQWKPRAELERKLVNQGWKISNVKQTNGCYEVYARDEKNRRVEAFFHPLTLAPVIAEAK